jgi:hypothetical protein
LSRHGSGTYERDTALTVIVDDDIVWDVGDFPGRKAYGREGVREFFRQWIGAFDEFRYEGVEFIDGGHTVFVHMRQWGRGKTSGVTTEADFWQVWLFFEGKVVRLVHKPTRREALEAAGVQE